MGRILANYRDQWEMRYMWCANAFCCDMANFVFSAEKVLAFKNWSATIQENEHVFDNEGRHFPPKNHSCGEKWEIACHLLCIGCGLLFWSLIIEKSGMKRP